MVRRVSGQFKLAQDRVEWSPVRAKRANTQKVRESALINLNSGSVKGAPMSARLCGTVARCTTFSLSLYFRLLY